MSKIKKLNTQNTKKKKLGKEVSISTYLIKFSSLLPYFRYPVFIRYPSSFASFLFFLFLIFDYTLAFIPHHHHPYLIIPLHLLLPPLLHRLHPIPTRHLSTLQPSQLVPPSCKQFCLHHSCHKQIFVHQNL